VGRVRVVEHGGAGSGGPGLAVLGPGEHVGGLVPVHRQAAHDAPLDALALLDVALGKRTVTVLGSLHGNLLAVNTIFL